MYINAQSKATELKILVDDGVDIGELPVIGIYQIYVGHGHGKS